MLTVLLSVLFAEKIYWCWTSSLKLWIMRKLSRRRHMKLRGFLVRFLHFIGAEKKCAWLWYQHSAALRHTHTKHNVFLADALRFPLWTRKIGWTVSQSDALERAAGLVLMKTWTCLYFFVNSVLIATRYSESDVTANGNGFTHRCSIIVPACIC